MSTKASTKASTQEETGKAIAEAARMDSQRACMALLGRMAPDSQDDATIKALMSVNAWEGLLGYLSMKLTAMEVPTVAMAAHEPNPMVAFESVHYDYVGEAIKALDLADSESFVREVLALESSESGADVKLVQIAVKRGMARDTAKWHVAECRRKQAVYALRNRTADALDKYMGKNTHAALVKAARKRARIDALQARLESLWERAHAEISAMPEIESLARRLDMAPAAVVAAVDVDDMDRIRPESLTRVSAWYGKKAVMATLNKDGIPVLFDSYSALLTFIAQQNEISLPHGTFRMGGGTVRIDSAGIAVDGGRFSHKALAGQLEIFSDGKRTSKIAVAAMTNTACFIVPSRATTDSVLDDLIKAMTTTTIALYDKQGGICGEEVLRKAIMREVAQ